MVAGSIHPDKKLAEYLSLDTGVAMAIILVTTGPESSGCTVSRDWSNCPMCLFLEKVKKWARVTLQRHNLCLALCLYNAIFQMAI